MNPFLEKPISLIDAFENWKQLYPKPYNKHEVHPYTKARILLMNAAECEAGAFSHRLSRHTADNDLRRELALTRALEKRQQIKISLLKPCNECALEHTVSYEQLAVDLTAELAKRENDNYVKQALEFALSEDVDHLYRFANLLELTSSLHAERLVGRYTEIMPARPTVSHHRHPIDNVRRAINAKTAEKFTVLSAMIITAAKQQTLNFYTSFANLAPNDMARRLYQEIALVEEEHVTQYESLMDANCTWPERLLWHEYAECYLYWSCMMTETDDYIKALWEQNLAIEIAHLNKAAELLQKYEHKEWQEVTDGEFPAPLSLHENVEYVRNILGNTVQLTSVLEDYEKVDNLPADANFFSYQRKINSSVEIVPSHNVVETHVRRFGKDYRYEIAPNPIAELQSRTRDNTTVGRTPCAGAGGHSRHCERSEAIQ